MGGKKKRVFFPLVLCENRTKIKLICSDNFQTKPNPNLKEKNRIECTFKSDFKIIRPIWSFKIIYQFDIYDKIFPYW